MRTNHLLGAFAACIALLIAACGSDGPLGLDSADPMDYGTAHLSASAAETADINGDWNYSSENFIHLAEWAAVLFGLEPEGNRTTLRCASEGTMNIVQTGSSFTGSILSLVSCVTSGGQVIAFPESAPLVEGTIRGNAMHFVLLGEPGGVECPQKGTIRRNAAGAPEALSGTFACIEPGHPRSTWFAPPPRGGPNRTQWDAVRP